MYELHHLKGNTYYIDGPTNIGLYKLNDTDVALIDCGTYKEAPIIETLLRRNKLKLKYIVDTHTHQDHSGGNLYLMKITKCKVIASKIERAFFRNPKLDLGFLNGGYPLDEYDNTLMHIDEQREIYSLEELPRGLRSFKLPGHHYDMIGIRTADGVNFIADSVVNEELLKKENIVLIFDVAGYLDSLDYVKKLDGIIVPSHSDVTDDIRPLVNINKEKINEIINFLLSILDEYRTMEDIIALTLTHYNIIVSFNKYLLMGSTIRSYIAYLSNRGLLDKKFVENKLLFIKKATQK